VATPRPRTRALRLALAPGADHDGPATPPRAFRIFRAGVNPSTKGDFLFDAAAAQSVMAAARAWGNRYPIDYGHAQVEPQSGDPAQDGKAAGWFTPALRGGELWATAVAWTPAAAAMIAAREYAYFSPAFNVDADGRVVELTNVALTNLPAMHGLTPLVAASRTPRRLTMDKAKICDAIHALHTKMHGAMHDEAAKKALDAKLEGMSAEECSAYHDKLAKFVPGDHAEPDGDEAPAKDDAKASDPAADTSASQAQAHSRAGVSDDARVMLARIAELERETKQLAAARDRDERAVVLERAVRDGKVTPAEARGEGKRGAFLGKLSTAQLAEYVAAAEARVTTTETKPGAGDAAAAGAGGVFQVELHKGAAPVAVTLSAVELKLAEEFGNDPAAVAKTKALAPWTRRTA